METLKKSMPTLAKVVSEWFEIELTIRVFGVKVFSFVWPPKASENQVSNLQVTES